MESDPALAEVAISAAENAAAAAAAATAESEDRDGHGREAAGTLLESGVEEQVKRAPSDELLFSDQAGFWR